MHAAKGGARSTTSVDLSKTYLDWARRNLSLNGFSDKNRLEQGDVMAWLESCRDEYDLIFIDPPTFSNSKRMEGIFDVQRDQVQLIDLAMARLARAACCTSPTTSASSNWRRTWPSVTRSRKSARRPLIRISPAIPRFTAPGKSRRVDTCRGWIHRALIFKGSWIRSVLAKLMANSYNSTHGQWGFPRNNGVVSCPYVVAPRAPKDSGFYQ